MTMFPNGERKGGKGPSAEQKDLRIMQGNHMAWGQREMGGPTVCVHRGKGRTAERPLLQRRILGFCLLQDGDVGIGIFPEGQKVFVGGERPYARGIAIRAL